MSKYSLQTECLENIEAFSDEQLASEMAVIESAFDIFEKSILMMKLAADTDIVPDCPIFMESFIQEDGETDQGAQPANNDTQAPADNDGGNQAPAADTNNGTENNNSGDGNNKSISDEERKAYNKEHWVRMKTKEGKLENIFISIIAFIPRLLGFIIQCIVRFFKKLTNKETDESIKNASKNAQNMDSNTIAEAINAGESENSENNNESKETAGTMDPNTKAWKWFNEQKILEAINNFSRILSNFNVENIQTFINSKNEMIKAKEQLDAAIAIRVEGVSGETLVATKDNIIHQLNALSDTAKRTIKTINNFTGRKREDIPKSFKNGEAVKEAKATALALKSYAASFGKDADLLIGSYNQAANTANKLNNAGGNNQGGNNNNAQQSAPQQQQPAQGGGNNNNGGQNQNQQQ